MPFENVVGQRRPKKILQGALGRGTLASSYLFCGPPGVGKLAMALELALAVNCQSDGPQPCGRCAACRKIRTLSHPDVSVLFPVPSDFEKKEAEFRQAIQMLAADPYGRPSFSKNAEIRIDAARRIRSEAVTLPYEARKKVFILADADQMNLEAANALLKTLEEPPAHMLLILTSARPGSLPPTILSRCQQIRFSLLSRQDISLALENLSLGQPAQRDLAGRLAQGNLRRAKELLQEGLDEQRLRLLKILSAAFEGGPLAVIRSGQALGTSRHRSESEQLLETLRIWYRDLLILKEGSEGQLINIDMKPRLAKIAAQYHSDGIHRSLGFIDESRRAMDANVNLELVWTVLFFRLKRLRQLPVH